MKVKPVKINVELPFNEILKVIDGLAIDQKVQILEMLEKETFKNRFLKLTEGLKDNTLSMDDITKEVETVRAARYARKKRFQGNH